MLKLGMIRIRDVRFGKKTQIKNGVLRIKKSELLEAARGEDKRIISVSADIARPGSRTRIIPIKDVVEPRVKIEGEIGQGYTKVLSGMSVITCGQIVGFQEGFLDMSGPGAEYSSFSKLTNVVLCPKVAKGLTPHQHEEVLRQLGLRTADFLAQTGKIVEPDQIQEFERLSSENFDICSPCSPESLPKVVYIYMLLSQGLLHDTYVYGKDAKNLLPTILQPTEIMDGAIVSGNCVSACDKNTTYHHQNNPIIKELYKMHGKIINFVGCIITNESTKLADKQLSAAQAVKLTEYLRAKGAIISKEGFGNPDADLIMICSGLEKKGIKTVCITDEFAGSDGGSQSLADATPEADAVVSTGNANEKITLPPMEKVIGELSLVKKLAGGYPKSLKENGSLEVELQAILGATNQLGFEKLSTTEV